MPEIIAKATNFTNGILHRQRFLNLFKEVFRKSIHICSAFVPFLLTVNYNMTIAALFCCLIIYCTCEVLRLKGITVPIISAITEAAARKRDEDRFVLGPVTLTAGIIITSLLFPLPYCAIGIFALAFGDGLASLAGKMFGRIKIPLTQGKTVAGSLTCFTAIFISCYLACLGFGVNADITFVALVVASAGMLIEVLPLKDLDNVLIPVILGFITTLMF